MAMFFFFGDAVVLSYFFDVRVLLASDSIGTLHVAHFVPFEHNHIGFFTVFDGDMEKYFQDFADKTSFVFDSLFPRVTGGPPTPVAKNAQAFSVAPASHLTCNVRHRLKIRSAGAASSPGTRGGPSLKNSFVLTKRSPQPLSRVATHLLP